jgi:hypothetical protein
MGQGALSRSVKGYLKWQGLGAFLANASKSGVSIDPELVRSFLSVRSRGCMSVAPWGKLRHGFADRLGRLSASAVLSVKG